MKRYFVKYRRIKSNGQTLNTGRSIRARDWNEAAVRAENEARPGEYIEVTSIRFKGEVS